MEGTVIRQHLEGNIAQARGSRDARGEDSEGLAAFGYASVELTLGQLPTYARIRHGDGEPFGVERQVQVRGVLAVEPQDVRWTGKADGVGVHDPAAYPDELAFRAQGRVHAVHGRGLQAPEVIEGEGRADADRGRG